MKSTDQCLCHSGKTFGACCEPILKKGVQPKTAEELLRARYSAFALGEIDYIVNTHHSKTRGEVKRSEIEEWSKNSQWLGLEVLNKEAGEPADDKGVIIFHAKYSIDGKENDHYEKSFFEKENGEWKFYDAHGLHQGPYVRQEPKVGRNDPCNCGSGKKFKKCHGAA